MAFGDLGTERQFGMGLGPIPRSKVFEYGRDELGITGDRLDQFAAIIRIADGEYLSLINDASGADKKKVRNEVLVDDSEGVKALLTGLQKKANPKQ